MRLWEIKSNVVIRFRLGGQADYKKKRIFEIGQWNGVYEGFKMIILKQIKRLKNPEKCNGRA